MSDFARRHYQTVARAIRDAKAGVNQRAKRGELTQSQHTERMAGIRAVERSLAGEFRSDNPRFSMNRFREACEPTNS